MEDVRCEHQLDLETTLVWIIFPGFRYRDLGMKFEIVYVLVSEYHITYLSY